MKKWIMILSILTSLGCQLASAETCPSVSAIKNNQAAGWKAYDSDDGTALSPTREAQFKEVVLQFALAEWVNAKNSRGSIHCYYRDKTGSNLEAYLAKDNVKPKINPKQFWYTVSGYMHCAAGTKSCEFENPLFNQKQLAKK